MTTQHLEHDELTAIYYGEPAPGHLAECAACREELARLASFLDSIAAIDAPEPPAELAPRVWSRIESERSTMRFKKWIWPAAAAAAVVLAFQAGRYVPATPASQPGNPEAVYAARLGEHLERTERLVVTMSNIETRRPVPLDREYAQELLDDNRFYRNASTGIDRELLEKIERILIEVSHAPDEVSPGLLEEWRERIESDDLIFRIRIHKSQPIGEPRPEKSL